MSNQESKTSELSLHDLLAQVRACRHCEADLPLGPRPVLRASHTARLLIIGQAPGTRVHAILQHGDSLWIGTEGGVAVAKVDGEELSVERVMPSKPVRALVALNGRIYVATWGGGVLSARGEGPLKRLASIATKATSLVVHETPSTSSSATTIEYDRSSQVSLKT